MPWTQEASRGILTYGREFRRPVTYRTKPTWGAATVNWAERRNCPVSPSPEHLIWEDGQTGLIEREPTKLFHRNSLKLFAPASRAQISPLLSLCAEGRATNIEIQRKVVCGVLLANLQRTICARMRTASAKRKRRQCYSNSSVSAVNAILPSRT